MRNSSPSTRGQQRYTRSKEGFRTDSPRSRDDDLTLFHDMRTCENKNFLHLSSDDIEASLSTKIGGLTGFQISASQTPPWKGNDLLSTADTEKNDYNWLLTPPGTPLFPSLDEGSLQSYMDRGVLAQPNSAMKVSRFSGSSHTSGLDHRFLRKSPGPRTPTSTVPSATSPYSASRNRAPSPSRARLSPTLRPASPATLRPASPAKTLAKATTMLNRSSARLSPPVLRRTNTSPSTCSSSTEQNASPFKGRSRGASVSTKLQAWQAPELGFSAEPPPNLRTSLDSRPASSSRNTSSRPRVANHVEARHSYLETVDGWQAHAASHRGRSSSSTSKFSCSTTSQDRWSSRGSAISSSDDGTDFLEPTFVDFGTSSPSPASGSSRTFTGRYDNDASSRCSSVANRQRRSSTSSSQETAGFSSASSRKPLEPSAMQRVDQRRGSQYLFRPLLSSAPTTSLYNIRQTVVRHRQTNSFAEQSITASSNASSEKGVRIFPGNESSDDEEIENGWHKSSPSGPAMSKTEIFENDALPEERNVVHDFGAHFDRESVAECASCVIDVTIDGREDTIMCTDTPDWLSHEVHSQRHQTSGETASRGADESSAMPKSVIKGVEHDQIEDNAVVCPIQRANIDQVFVDNQEDTIMQQLGSTCLNRDSVNPHDFGHGPDKPERTNQGASPESQKPFKPEQERFHEATCEAEEESVLRSSDQPKITLHEIRGSEDMDVVSSERLHLTKEAFCSSTSDLERVPSSAHSETEGNCPVEIPPSIRLSHRHHFSQEDPSICTPVPSAQEQEGSSGKLGLTSQDSCRECYIDMPESQENIHTRERKASSFCALSRKLSYADSEGPFSLDECSRKDEVDNAGVSGETRTINMNEASEKVKEVFSRDGREQLALSVEDHNCAHGNVLMSELPLSSSQDFKECVDVKENGTNDLNGNTDEDTDKPLGVLIDASADASDELDQLKLCAVDLAKALVFSEESSQIFNETCPPEVVSAQRDALEPVRSTNILQTVGVEETGIRENATLVFESKEQPHSTDDAESSSKVQASPGWKPATPSFSLEEATNTILFCSSIVHDMVYKATSIATDKEVAKMGAAAPWPYPAKGHVSNTDFINSLRGKVSKSGAWKGRSNGGKSLVKRPQGEDLTKPLATITQQPIPIDGMDKGPDKVEEVEKSSADNTKEKSFMGLSVNSNCQCSVM